MPPRKPKSNKNPPIFSHEFVIQNHADIVSCVAMMFILGLMFQATNKVAALFVSVQHNVTVNDTENKNIQLTFYEYGLKDAFSTFFYFLIAVVIHAVIQEYVLDKFNRKLHLSKTKHSKFNESGQLVFFYSASVVWGLDILIREKWITNLPSFWNDYPHTNMAFQTKFFVIVQLAYWLHNFPELYLQKVKKDEMAAKCVHPTLYLVFIIGGYVLNLNRLLIALIILHYVAELCFHAARLLYLIGKENVANSVFTVWNIIFIAARLATVTLSVLTLWFGLGATSKGKVDIKKGDFNTLLVRANALLAVGLLQGWLMWNFINFHLKRRRKDGSGSDGHGYVSSHTSAKATPSPKNKGQRRKVESTINGVKNSKKNH